MSTDPLLWEGLNAELITLFDSFGNLIRAANIPDEESEQSTFNKEKKAPGDLLEIWAEKVVYAGHSSLHILSQLKKGALLGDVNALVENVRAARAAFDRNQDATVMQLACIKQEVQDMLGQLEDSYYSSQHRGRVITAHVSSELNDLCLLALELRGLP